jgi:hypothetical protein
MHNSSKQFSTVPGYSLRSLLTLNVLIDTDRHPTGRTQYTTNISPHPREDPT